MAALTTALIVGGAVAASAISASAQKSAAEKQAQAQQEAINAQERIAQREIEAKQDAAEKERQEREAALAKEEAARREITATQKTAVEESLAREEAGRAAEREKFAKVLEETKIPAYGSTEAGKQLLSSIQSRIAGREESIAPYAEQIRQGVEREKSAVGSVASAAGLGRSILRSRLEGEATRTGETNIANEIVRQQSEAINQLQTYVAMETATNEKIAEFERTGQAALADAARNDLANIESARRALETQINELNLETEAISRGGALETTRLSTEASLSTAERESAFALNIANSVKEKGVTEAANDLLYANLWAQGITGATAKLSSSLEKSNTDILEAIQQQKSDRGLAAQVNIAKAGIAV